MDSRIEKYKFAGNVAIWKFPGNTNYWGWHIAMDKNGAKSLLELLTLMSSSKWPSRKLIDLENPLKLDQEWINTVDKTLIYKKVLLVYRPDEEELFYLDENGTNPRIYLGPSSCQEFVRHINKGSFDKAMPTPDGTNALNFW